MALGLGSVTPGLSPFIKSLRGNPVDSSIERFIALLKRRQIWGSRPCAIATAQLLFRVVAEFKGKDVAKLLRRVRDVGQRITAARPHEMVIGNIVRRVLGLVREVAEEGNDADTNAASESGQGNIGPHDSLHRPMLSSHISTFSPLRHGMALSLESSIYPQSQSPSNSQAEFSQPSQKPPLYSSHTSYANPNTPMVTSLFGLFSHPESPSNASTPTGYQSPVSKGSLNASVLEGLIESQSSKKENLKAEVLEGIRELLDELDQVDEQIAAYALEHIHSNEIILTQSSSTTVQRFLLTAAKKRKFTVIHAEAYPNDHDDTHATVLTGRKRGSADDPDADERFKPLTAAGITVVLIPDSAIFAIMARVNKVILATHTVLANGGLIAAVGARTIAEAAKAHQTPVIVVSGVYKLSPVYPFNIDEMIEVGDSSRVVEYEDGGLVDKIDVTNPICDYVPADLLDLYITNLGGHAPSYLYRIVADHYRDEDINL